LLFEVSRFSIVRAQEAARTPGMWITAVQAVSLAVEYKPGMSVPLRAVVRIQLALEDQSMAKVGVTTANAINNTFNMILKSILFKFPRNLIIREAAF
jgi:hypothetical protein